MRNRLKELVDQALPELLAELKLSDVSPKDVCYEIEIPKNKAHGDFSVNVAFQLGRSLKKNPLDIAARCHKIFEKNVEKTSLARWTKLECTVYEEARPSRCRQFARVIPVKATLASHWAVLTRRYHR